MLRFTGLYLIYILISSSAIAQSDTIRYCMDYNGKKCIPEYCYYYRIAFKSADLWNVQDYFAKEQILQMTGQYLDDSFKIAKGPFYYYYKNGRLESIERYDNGKLNGLNKDFDSTGQIVDSSFYKNGIRASYSYSWYNNGKLKGKGIYDNEGKGAGEEWSYYPNGVLADHGKLSEGYLKDSIWTHYYTDGNISCQERYYKGIIKKIECFNVQTHQPEYCKNTNDENLKIAQKTFRKLRKKYKKEVIVCMQKTKGKKGRFVANLCVDINGKPSINVLQSYDPCFDTVLIKIFSDFQFKPAMEFNRPVERCAIRAMDFK
jgi:antitoxin component YwqK of YwqJK toxin-antitoxin module